jgi:hypothetical protein
MYASLYYCVYVYCLTLYRNCNQQHTLWHVGANWYISLVNSVALVHKQTIPTERRPHVGEVSANFCG